MPYISNKNNRRDELEPIIKLIGQLDILGDEISSKENTLKIVKMMLNLNVEVNGDLNYILYAVCKRYVKPSYNNYKKYLTKLTYSNSNFQLIGDIPEILYGFYFNYIYGSPEAEQNKRISNLAGELDFCAKEIYRRLITPYEDEKIKENGDV